MAMKKGISSLRDENEMREDIIDGANLQKKAACVYVARLDKLGSWQ